jgi:hypothetical protein
LALPLPLLVCGLAKHRSVPSSLLPDQPFTTHVIMQHDSTRSNPHPVNNPPVCTNTSHIVGVSVLHRFPNSLVSKQVRWQVEPLEFHSWRIGWFRENRIGLD